MARFSVVDSNTLNLDPDPEFWSDLDPDSIFRKKIINFLDKSSFRLKK